jgi:hypothetical protein
MRPGNAQFGKSGRPPRRSSEARQITLICALQFMSVGSSLAAPNGGSTRASQEQG